MTDLNGRVALVTGASRGIGRAIAFELGRRGATVVVNFNTSTDRADTVVRTIEANGGNAVTFQADVSDKAQIDAMFNFVKSELGRLDIFVSNAGITRDGLAARINASDYNLVMNTNVFGPMMCCGKAFRLLRKSDAPRIVLISSVVGISGNAGQVLYAASKGAVIGMTKSLAREFASAGILVNCVAPGYIETDMTHGLGEDVLATVVDHTPLARTGWPEEVAQEVAYLVSPDTTFITGQVRTVSGGMVM